ncbi:efflux pump antibiotic resistance protein [Beauveria bassiana ARSEF 2860]|uniref:Efflux pump antibiotic resistance protein n=1 Tax=Beauveria bassiana (strain ARSEF 2860) TaxID=655819 RepID=J5J8Q5_BEAB2|nr:efflux pump antibiotic resistance protein [Beauveria bassiana ARSEF 2860]EJP62713.1 efflux pump antibiotic resistance protein [Beauveria bassiana ARSEF 2860]
MEHPKFGADGDGLLVIHVALYRMATRSFAEAYRILGYKTHHGTEDLLGNPWLIAAYPKAKIVVVQRDFESWWASYQAGVLDHIFPRRQWLTVWLIRNVLRSRAADAMIKVNYGLFNATNMAGIKDNARKTYDEYYRNIRERIPAERRLEYTMGDGWEPLCAFLGEKVPDVPFPRLNDSAYRKRSQQAGEMVVFLTSAKRLAWLALAIGAVSMAFWHMSI